MKSAVCLLMFVILTYSNRCVYHLYLTLALIYLRGHSMDSHFRHVQMFTHEYSYDIDCSEGEIRQLVVYGQYAMYSIKNVSGFSSGALNIYILQSRRFAFWRGPNIIYFLNKVSPALRHKHCTLSRSKMFSSSSDSVCINMLGWNWGYGITERNSPSPVCVNEWLPYF